MKVIGLTGGIGTGKSTVADYLKELGASIIDLDKVGHEALAGENVRKQIITAFGQDIRDENGEIDRARLGEKVFNDPPGLERLIRILHPVIDKMVDERLAACRRRGAKVAVLEAAAMPEAGGDPRAEELWVTTAPETAVLERLKAQRDYSAEEALARIRNQLPAAARLAHADVVIENAGTLGELKARVEEEWRKLMERIG
jgi:dephospho-CoA kinase